MKQENTRSELQQKVAADIAERARAREAGAAKPNDGVEDSQFVTGTSRMSKRAMLIVVAVVIVAVAVTVTISTIQ